MSQVKKKGAKARPSKVRRVTDDPFRAREASKYESPVASREFIVAILAETNRPLTFQDLIDRLSLQDQPEQQEGLRRRLGAMLRDGQLIRNRKGGYVPVDQDDLVAGRISAHPDGFGFLLPENGSDDVYISARQMRQVLHGDKVVVGVVNIDRRGRREGRIVEVLERANHQVVGRFCVERGIYFIVPDNKRLHQDLLIPETEINGATHGDMVIGDIVEQPSHRHPPVGRIARVLGQHLKPGMETDVAIATFEIPHLWPEEVMDDAVALGDEVSESAKAGRKDIRDLPLVTIDGEDSRDFDDAVYCEKRENGWRLLVAIADVSHYVEPYSAFDQEALKRGTSVYFPGRVVPMLPEALSNGLCSLNPQVDRLCLLADLLLDNAGNIKRTRFHRAVMRSHARLTYTEVAAMLVDKDKALQKKYKPLLPHLRQLHQLYKVLERSRRKRGAMEFESNETRLIFDDQQKISEIRPVKRNDAHKLIEECMILANIAAARYLERRKMPALYRVHQPPVPVKLDDLRAFLSLRGLSLGGGDSPTAQDYGRLAKKIADRADAPIIQTMLLRSMQQALYQPVNDGHFGLALEHYAHFTSPIRRYPDLLVHRAIVHLIEGGKPSGYLYDQSMMSGLGESCSMLERRADEATRDVTAWLKCEYMRDHVGDQFDGVVSAVTSFGMFVHLPELLVEGLVHITNLGHDYYHFDQVAHTLAGERFGKVYHMGQAVRVAVAAVNLEERKIDFQLVEKSGRKNSQDQKKDHGKKVRGKKTRGKKTRGKIPQGKKTQGKIPQGKKTQGKKTQVKKSRGRKKSKSGNHTLDKESGLNQAQAQAQAQARTGQDRSGKSRNKTTGRKKKRVGEKSGTLCQGAATERRNRNRHMRRVPANASSTSSDSPDREGLEALEVSRSGHSSTRRKRQRGRSSERNDGVFVRGRR